MIGYRFAKLGQWGAAVLVAASLAACDNPSTAEEASEDRAERIAQMEKDLAAEKAAAKEEAREQKREVASAQTKEREVVKERVVYRDPPKPAICVDCGTVASIQPVKAKGDASGAGAVMGAIAGGVIGHQIGSGRGNDAATAAGAIGGGFAGHEIEKQVRSTTYYKVDVSMEDGSTRTVNLNTTQGISVGSKVRVVGNDLQLRG